MRTRSSLALTGFTLIELLVVVAIIGLLMSILLPSLASAREQGKLTVCLANQRSIGLAAATYGGEFDDFPFVLPEPYAVGNRVYNFNVLTGFIWGGGMPDKTAADWAASGADWQARYVPDVNVIPPRYRPVNRYITSNVSWDREAGERTNRPAEIPGFFRCPGDSSLSLGWVGRLNQTDDINTPWQTWAFLGTSYTINFYWPYYYQKAPPGDAPPYSRQYINIVGGRSDIKSLGRHMLKNKTGRWASEFILFCENRMNFALSGARPRGAPNGSDTPKLIQGWHKKRDYHAAVFLDGHAVYRQFDTRYVDGPGWTTWPTKPWQGEWEQYNSN